jgi:hypothetical protein
MEDAAAFCTNAVPAALAVGEAVGADGKALLMTTISYMARSRRR